MADVMGITVMLVWVTAAPASVARNSQGDRIFRQARPTANNHSDGPRAAGAAKRQELAERREMVGARGFEPPTPCTPCRCATRLRHAPTGRLWKEDCRRLYMGRPPARPYIAAAVAAR